MDSVPALPTAVCGIVTDYDEIPMYIRWNNNTAYPGHMTTVILPFVENEKYKYNCTIHWGDGSKCTTLKNKTSGPVKHRFHRTSTRKRVGMTEGTITITGSVPAWDCGYHQRDIDDGWGSEESEESEEEDAFGVGEWDKFNVLQWITWGTVGRLGTQHTTGGFFRGCSQLTYVERPPDIQSVRSTRRMFKGAHHYTAQRPVEATQMFLENEAITHWFTGYITTHVWRRCFDGLVYLINRLETGWWTMYVIWPECSTKLTSLTSQSATGW